jgi:hypothetical protein
MRLHALGALHAALGHSAAAPLAVSSYKQHRLRLLLRVLDCIDNARGISGITRHVAQSVVFPDASLDRNANWKTSSRRRQTQRLINEAQSLAGGGYLGLLNGSSC